MNSGSDAHLHFFPELLTENVGWQPSCALLNATCEADWNLVAQAASRNAAIQPFFGIHPWWTETVAEGWDVRLAELLDRFPKAGIGEIGLDALRKEVNSPETVEAQKRLFRAQLELAVRWERPVSVHCVRAWDWLWEPLRKTVGRAGQPILFHAFSGSPEQITQILENFRWNAFFSLASFRFQPESRRFLRLLPTIPQDRLLLETDTDSQSDAQKIGEFYEKLSPILGLTPERLAELTNQNLNRFLNRT